MKKSSSPTLTWTITFGILSQVFFISCKPVHTSVVSEPETKSQAKIIHQEKADGYRGIWFTLNQFSEYGDKYSGGLGTYTAKHVPLAVYAPEEKKTFFVYGGTTTANEKHLLCMVSYYDHEKHQVPRPTIVHDKNDVDDPHDNPSIMLDADGYLWVFVSGRGQNRPGYKYKSLKPYSIDAFEQISEEEMTYPQPWYISGQGYMHLFTKYTGVRELYFETSQDGVHWSEDQKLAGIRESSNPKGGHYQVSNVLGNKVATFFNRHPNGNVDKRTDLYYLQTRDMGKTWTTVEGKPVHIPLTKVDEASIADYASEDKNVYLKDMNFDEKGHPIALYITSGGHEPGPINDPREWRVTYWDGISWQTHIIGHSDHNYDMGSLYIEGDEWKVIAPTENGPQPYQTGGEVVMWISHDKGKTWQKEKQLTKNSIRNHSYCRRPVNAHDPFYTFWADGNPTEFSISYLYFANAQGQVWQLPYQMKDELAAPIETPFFLND